MRQKLRIILVMSVFILLIGNQVVASKWEWGLRAGFVRSKSSFSEDLPYITIDSLDSFSVGVFFYHFLIRDRLGIQPELHYTIKGFDVLEEDLGQDISSKYKVSYFEIPVLIIYKLPIKSRLKPGLVFGPYWGIAHKVTEVQTAFGNTEKRKLDENLKNTDAGFVFGGNIRYRLGSLDILFSVRYYLGLTNISKDIMEVSYDFRDNDTIKNRALTLSLGVSFIPSANR
jgi:hypothetical protein